MHKSFIVYHIVFTLNYREKLSIIHVNEEIEF